MFKFYIFLVVLLQLHFVMMETLIARKIVHQNFNTSVQDNCSNFDTMEKFTEYFNNFILGRLPPFDLTISHDISSICRSHSAEYQKQLQNLSFWALKMYDASAKIPSGLLNGNIFQFGDFDECINSHSDDGEIAGQYCLVDIQTVEPSSKSDYLLKLNNLINTYYPTRSDFDDAGHIGPRMSSIRWALCVPASCSHQDVEIGLTTGLQSFAEKIGIPLQIKVFDESCQIIENPISWSAILAGLLFVVYILFVITVTIVDYYFQYPINDANGLLWAFSLHRNLKSLFSYERSTDDIKSVHGIRFLNMLMIFLSHKTMYEIYSGYVNKADWVEFLISPLSLAGRATILYTDTFLMLSGMLLAYSYFGRINSGKQVHIIEEFISRLARILPTLFAVIFFVGFIHPWLSSGPQWNAIVGHNSKLCRNYWWRNLLFIQNFFGVENMCLASSHHIATDTLLFLISPIFLWMLLKWKKFGVFIILIVATWSTVLRYNTMYTKKVSANFHYGTRIKQLVTAADYMYVMPTHRITVYLLGILLGYYLRSMKNISLKPIVLNIGHATAIALFSIVFVAPAFTSGKSYKYDPSHPAWYAGYGPIPWCLVWAWIIFTDCFGFHNILTKLLSWRGFLISTRLSYAIYLVQLPMLGHNAATNRSSNYFHLFKTLFNFRELSVLILLSIILTVLFEKPFETIKKICLKKYKKRFTKQITTKKDD